jgi:hypothetical protein
MRGERQWTRVLRRKTNQNAPVLIDGDQCCGGQMPKSQSSELIS